MVSQIAASLALSVISLTPTDLCASEIDLEAAEIFIPVGYDSNDEVIVVVDGFLASSCYRLSDVNVGYHEEDKTFGISLKQRLIPSEVCLPMLIPYTKEVSLGTLTSGKYHVRTNAGDISNELLVTEPANLSGPGTDNDYYALVEQAWVNKSPDSGKLTMTLEIRMTSNCATLRDVKIEYHKKTIVVLPLLRVENQSDCQPLQTSLTVYRELEKLPWGRYLLHVRSLNGQALNQVFSVFDTRRQK